jgi:small subunit ribosomal protein S16
VNQERVAYWLSVGAQPSERVAQLLKESAKAAA